MALGQQRNFTKISEDSRKYSLARVRNHQSYKGAGLMVSEPNQKAQVAPKKLDGRQIRDAAYKIITDKYADPVAAQKRMEMVRASATAAIDAGYNVIDVQRGSKSPRDKGWQDSLRDKTFLSGPQFDALGNYGIKPGRQYLVDENGAIVPDPHKAWLLVIDFDRDKNVEGSRPDRAIKAFRNEFIRYEGETAYNQFMAAAGQAMSPNGEHFYCLLPIGVMMKGATGIYSFSVNEGGDGSAIDLRCRNNQVLAHGSETATVVNTDGSIAQHGGIYQWKPNGFKRYGDLPTLPDSMCKWFAAAIIGGDTVTAESAGVIGGQPIPSYAKGRATGAPALGFSSAGRQLKDPQRVKDALLHSVKADPERYKNRDGWLHGIGLPLPGAVATGELNEEEGKSIYDACCDAAPGDKTGNEEQWEKNLAAAHDRAKAGENLLGVKSIIDQAVADGWDDPAQTKDDSFWPGGITKSGPLLNALNAETTINKLGFRVRLNERRGEHEVFLPDSYVPQFSSMKAEWNRFDDPALRLVTNTISRVVGRSFPMTAVDEALQLMGDRRSFDPIRDWFETLTHDGVPRLDTWLTAYLGVEDTLLHRQWARLWLIGAVTRTYSPGCKFDFILMLISGQGTGKSSIGSALIGDDYFTDQLEIGADAKTIIEQTSGALIVELGEMVGMGSRDLGAIKHMASTQSDKARMAYARKASEIPRRFIMYGSSNNDTPLRDPTGNRRFWTVKVGNILLTELKRDALQLWAEAVHVFKTEFFSDARKVMLDPKWYDQATEVQKNFAEAPAWEDKVADLLESIGGSIEIITRSDGTHARWVTSNQLMQQLVPNVDIHTGHQRKLSNAMKGLGWIRERYNGKRGYYQKVELPEITAEAEAGGVSAGDGVSLQ